MKETVRYRDVSGVLREAVLLVEDDVTLSAHALPTRRVVDVDGTSLLQKWVPEWEGQQDPRMYEQLDAEIRALSRLGQVYPGRNHPVEVSRLVGYNVDVREPFALLEMYRGEPVADLLTEIDDRVTFQRSLLTGLLYLARIDIVHGEMAVDAVRWNGRAVQIVDFEDSMLVGWNRRPGGRVPLRSPDQVEGRGVSVLADDVWGAGIVLRQIELGRLNVGTDIDDDAVDLRYLLRDVFDEDPERRPSAAAMLVRLKHQTVLRPGGGQAAEEGYAMFARRRTDKLLRLHGRQRVPRRWPRGSS